MRWLLLFAVFLAACGSDTVTPTAPPPPLPSANIVSSGGGTFTSCNIVFCTATFPMQNTGAGCAQNVRGTVTFFNGSQQLGAEQWSHPNMVRPNESFVVTKTVVEAFRVATNYRLDPAWDTVRCP